MYTLTIFALIAVVVVVFVAVFIPALRRQMRAVPGTGRRAASFRRREPNEPRDTDRTQP